MYGDFTVNIIFLFCALAFIIGLRKLSSPDTARTGNLIAGGAMITAIIVALFSPMATDNNNYLWIAGGLLAGGLIGYRSAMKIALTAMPQLVSLFNGFGGACAILLGLIEVFNNAGSLSSVGGGQLAIILFTILVGSVSFTGSLLAWGKLDGRVNDKKITFPGHNIVNNVLILGLFALAVLIAGFGFADSMPMWTIFIVVSLIYGFSFVAPIGGADMPVVISLLNSFTGLTAAAAGLIYGNQLMLLGGILVGAAGTILTILMCQAMNRSLWNVIVGSFGGGGVSAGAQGDQVAKVVNASDAAIMLYYAQSVIFIPGYGLAVAQAQKMCKELADRLEENGVDVKYAIHPVAGRMPGHMNVLLAEADVPYPKMIDLETANPLFPSTDVAVVVGANDVVNPAAQDDPGSPIYGMPVLEVWKAKNVIVMKRSMSAGYAGIQNQLFFHERNRMLFGDAKATMEQLVQEVKNL